MPSSEPVATLKTATQPDLAPLAALSASASSSLDRIEAQLGSLEAVGTPLTDGNLGEGAAALALVAESAAELQAAYAFIDQLAESVAAAGLLVEATERRLEVLERGEKLPESIASLPPPMFTNHQFTRQIRRRERAAPPDLPELTLLPPSQAASAFANALFALEPISTLATLLRCPLVCPSNSKALSEYYVFFSLTMRNSSRL